MTILRFRYQQLSGHVHVRVFTATMFDGTFASVGNLVFSEREWPCVATGLTALSTDDAFVVQIKHEDEL